VIGRHWVATSSVIFAVGEKPSVVPFRRIFLPWKPVWIADQRQKTENVIVHGFGMILF
jgi:hypothetical protein